MVGLSSLRLGHQDEEADKGGKKLCGYLEVEGATSTKALGCVRVTLYLTPPPWRKQWKSVQWLLFVVLLYPMALVHFPLRNSLRKGHSNEIFTSHPPSSHSRKDNGSFLG
jgi:hypothetical protein